MIVNDNIIGKHMSEFKACIDIGVSIVNICTKEPYPNLQIENSLSIIDIALDSNDKEQLIACNLAIVKKHGDIFFCKNKQYNFTLVTEKGLREKSDKDLFNILTLMGEVLSGELRKNKWSQIGREILKIAGNYGVDKFCERLNKKEDK